MPPQDDIFKVFEESLPELKNGDVLIITSKILGIHQGRCVKIKEGTPEEINKLALEEADWYVPKSEATKKYGVFTIKYNSIIASAGIDKSNSNGYYTFLPRDVNILLNEIRDYLKKKYKIQDLGIIAVDSHCIPLRAGIVGTSIGFVGMEPIKDYVGKKDIFGREFKFSRVNVIDSLSSISVLLMGEGNELTPMMIIRGCDFISFTNKDTQAEINIDPKDDIFEPLLKIFKKNK